MRARYAPLVAAALCVLSVCGPAFAQRVLLVRPSESDAVLLEAFNRLRAELALQGFEISVAELSASESSPERLTALAKATESFAGVSLTRRSGSPAAEVCIADRVTGKTSLRSLAIGKASDAPSVLAVRSADLLRASLREFTDDRPPPKDVVGVDYERAPVAVETFARESPPRFRLDARAAALGFSQSLGPGYGPSLALRYRAAPRLWISLLAVGPAVGASFETSLGSATLRQELAVAQAAVGVLSSDRFDLRCSAAAGAYHFSASGQVNPPLAPQRAQVTSFATGLGVEAELHLTSAFSVSAELGALVLAPRPAVALLDRQYDFAWPFLTASAGIGAAF